ncbi:hypothetical protein EC973_008782 [Apophysomyces ossiformis]|uniref:Uncharacterized protein n=1 Tax=Apophysomyces ossiformis TaxID=679940 RepID=A0A8H7BUV9_9FUNG|nr:hypothetical protein EC973_008782 [Apophysomyces ossiformis]
MHDPSVEKQYVQWRQRYLRSYHDGLYVYYKEPSEHSDAMTCSEAHGYGMLISVLKRNQADFDGLYRYFIRFRNHKGLMQWQQKRSHSGEFVPGDEGGTNCATDGDVDICTALFLAAKVWGHGGQHGEINYRQTAVDLCAAIHKHCIHPQTHMPLIGDWTEHGSKEYRLSRPSDFILSGFHLFYMEDKERQHQWSQTIHAILNTCQQQLHFSQSGLIADFLQENGGHYQPVHGEVLESKHDGDYNWNSCRVPWRLGHYYMLTRDERIRPVLEAEAHFFAQQVQKGEIKAGYHLNGHSFVDYTDMAFMAPVSFLFWVLGWQGQLHQLLNQMNDAEMTYFGESIAMLCLLMANVPY